MGSTKAHPGPASAEPPRGRTSRGYVDYDRVAPLYRRGRSLPAEVLHRWGEAVRPHLPPDASLVVDVGAGTGVFTEAWSQWTRARVLAIEPSAAMVKAAECTDPAVAFVRAVAHDLPIRDRRAGVVWVSTALHHFADVNRATAEFRRVLPPGGRVLVRTYVPGRSEVSWADEFPGRTKWICRFHDEDELVTLFGSHDFDVVRIEEVLEWTEPYSASADWVSMMRQADSMLTALTDEEIAAGLDALRSRPDHIGRVEVTLLVFERQLR
jgi:SAM-dependent methyltransferase